MDYYTTDSSEQERKRLADLLAMQQDNIEPGVQFDTAPRTIADLTRGRSEAEINQLLSGMHLRTPGFDTFNDPPPQQPQRRMPQNYVQMGDNAPIDLGQSVRQHDVYRDGPQILRKEQNPDGTINQWVKRPTTDGFGRQSTVVVQETLIPDYLNPAKIKEMDYQKKYAELAQLQAKPSTPEQMQEIERRKAIGKQQGEMQGFGAIAQAGATGDTALSGIPPAMADQVKALADGRMAFPGGFALKSPYWQQMLQLVSQYDPSFDAVNYGSRAATRKDFTSGKSAENIKSLNTAIGHLGTLTEKFDKLNNSNFPSYNTAANWLGTKVGDEKIQAAVGGFDTAKLAVSGEMAKVFRSVGMSQQEIEHWMDRLSSSQTPADFKSTMKTATDLMAGRLDAIGDQYSKGMGKSTQGLDLLSPDAKKQFNAIQSGGGKVKLQQVDADAMAWAMKNPNDPRAAAIKEKLGVR